MHVKTIDQWETQFRKGILEALVLMAIRSKTQMYGYELVEFLKQQGLDCSEGTIYPLLNRMQKNEWLVSEWDIPVGSGSPRKWYKIHSSAGHLYTDMISKIDNYQTVISKIRSM